MSPAMIEVVAGLLLKYGPDVAQAIVKLFSQTTVSASDWDAIFALVRTKEQIYKDAQDRAAATAVVVAVPQPV